METGLFMANRHVLFLLAPFCSFHRSTTKNEKTETRLGLFILRVSVWFYFLILRRRAQETVFAFIGVFFLLG